MTKLDLHFPCDHTMEEVISALRNEADISSLSCRFDTDNFDTSEGLREAILSNKISGTVFHLQIGNFCSDRDTHRLCFDFYLRCLEGPENKTREFEYSSMAAFHMTLADAKRCAVAIASNNNIDLLSLSDLDFRGSAFNEEGTLECIFDAVLDGGVKVLDLNTAALKHIIKRLCNETSASKLATNTTLKVLCYTFYQVGAPTYRATDESNEGIKQLANILKVNKGLEAISIPFPLITNIGRRHLLGSLRDNTTLTTLITRESSTFVFEEENQVEEDETECDESISLQSQIDRHMMLNYIWKKYEEFASSKSGTSISLDFYPDLLEELARKPLLLFLFMQRNHPRIFTSFSTDHSRKRRRRRSMRIMKKKRNQVL
ncbi:hypothetical protein FRACYDRAFT_244053 [Fragilariopsis cylindrus CCMP1102]|uniref:RNI-like protein n=1 Tax=Fragilariopsis cylindrus CCMP1102 TaxID=635003 RepID=A0A1E7F3R2_9STRA|nr:hypothetical protein FRACYDRAFT_244053 [Fragilariopsis cylindrus CCMP1102]|eukprot:OEU12779.1 hypothetical protein FRACYDRAFT_244053 [Fragilariopsis cylindrus CCMP1102]